MADGVQVIHGDALADVLGADVLGYPHALGYAPPRIPDASVDAIVTDPPYGLEFMGKAWDTFGRDTGNHQHREKPRFTSDHMGKGFDKIPNTYEAGRPFQRWCEAWAAECLRVLKPGGYLVAFGGTRTVHRLTCGIEDAGFEIRDSIMWHYASGFPKSLNVNKDARFCRCDRQEWPYGDGGLLGVREGRPGVPPDAATGEVADLLAPVQREGARPGVGTARPQGHSGEEDPAGAPVRPGQPGVEGRGDVQAAEGQLRRPGVRPLPGGVPADGPGRRVRDGAPAGDGPEDRAAAAAVRGREPHRPQPAEQRAGKPGAVPVQRGPQAGRGWPVCGGCGKPSIPAGLGTALKPATEPIVVARKPLAGTVAANVLAYGTGALNIDACRVGTDSTRRTQRETTKAWEGGAFSGDRVNGSDSGRWPSNVVLSHPPLLDDAGAIVGDACAGGCVPGCPVAELDAQSGVRTSGLLAPHHKANVPKMGHGGVYGDCEGRPPARPTYGDSGGASRFFPVFRYQAKAPSRERPKVDGTAHPTVKPLDLMRWLVRLVTPPGGLVLDLFAGSGTTAEACAAEGFPCVAIEREPTYLPLIAARLDRQRHTQPALL